jgi:ribosomal protein L7/L12
LKDAKDMAEASGAKVLEAAGKEAAMDAKSKLETAGAKVELV